MVAAMNSRVAIQTSFTSNSLVSGNSQIATLMNTPGVASSNSCMATLAQERSSLYQHLRLGGAVGIMAI